MMHATCKNVHARGSLLEGDTFKALCGVEAVCGYADEKCPKCEALFNKYLNEPCPLCGLQGVAHDRDRGNLN